MHVDAIKTQIFREGDNLRDFIVRHVQALEENSIIIITSKIVALSERRTAPLESKQEIVLRESEMVVPGPYEWLTVKDGMFMTAAGIDESNAEGKLVLLPEDSFKSAMEIRKALQEDYKVKNLGVLISDSRVLPLRSGSVGMALGYAGFRGVKSYQGSSDLYGRLLTRSCANIADSLAAAGVMLMGEGREQTPLALIRDATVSFCEQVDKNELLIPAKYDLYVPLFSALAEENKKREFIDEE